MGPGGPVRSRGRGPVREVRGVRGARGPGGREIRVFREVPGGQEGGGSAGVNS